MDAVVVGDGRARIGAGARLGAVYDALDGHGVTIAAGCGPTVGISGLVLGGGLGILGPPARADRGLAARRRGRAGRRERGRCRCDLLWALRGAGGARFGVVTSLELATVPAPEMTAFETFWDDAAASIAAWQEWAPDAPDELAASLLITTPPLRVKVFGAYAGPEAMICAACSPSSARRRHRRSGPAARARRRRFLAGLGGAGEEEDGHPYLRSEYFAGRLPAAAIDALVEHLESVEGFHRELDFSPWGGAYNRTPAEATAFAHRSARFLLKHAAVIDPGTPPVAGARVDRPLVRDRASVRHRRRRIVNFPEDGLDLWAVEYHGANRSAPARGQAPLRPRGGVQ